MKNPVAGTVEWKRSVPIRSLKLVEQTQVVDTPGLTLVVAVKAANVNDQAGLRQLLQGYLSDGLGFFAGTPSPMLRPQLKLSRKELLAGKFRAWRAESTDHVVMLRAQLG